VYVTCRLNDADVEPKTCHVYVPGASAAVVSRRTLAPLVLATTDPLASSTRNERVGVVLVLPPALNESAPAVAPEPTLRVKLALGCLVDTDPVKVAVAFVGAAAATISAAAPDTTPPPAAVAVLETEPAVTSDGVVV
jgi:hypothetical protein